MPVTFTLALMESVVRVRARIELFAIPRGPGYEYYATGIKPNHFFPGVDGSTIGVVEFDGRDQLKFGESCDALVTFLWLTDWPPLVAGLTWRLQEGAKHVGNGRITEVLP